MSSRNLEIRDNFDAIAGRYDLTNRVLSCGIDLRWRHAAARRLGPLRAGDRVLDLACGTGDMALAVRRRHPGVRVVGVDLSRAMLPHARRKLASDDRSPAAGLVAAPAEALPFADGSFAAVTVAFGIRNVPDFRTGLREMARVLRPGGRACILEFSTPPSRFLWKAYNYYFFHVLPRIGGLLTGRESAYRYLTDSVASFPDAAAFAAAMTECGFRRVASTSMYGGIVCLHTGERP